LENPTALGLEGGGSIEEKATAAEHVRRWWDSFDVGTPWKAIHAKRIFGVSLDGLVS
jgi:hypothetical protein